MGIATLEPSLPLWIRSEMNASRLEQGLVFLPLSLTYLLGTNVFGIVGTKVGRWMAALVGMGTISICMILITFCTTIPHLIGPFLFMGFAIGMVDSSMLPIMGYLVDIRHVSVYGTVYAIADVAFCIGFAIGPAFSSGLVQQVGFKWMVRIVAIICALYAPFAIFLKNPPHREETQGLMLGSGHSKMSEYQTTNGASSKAHLDKDSTDKELLGSNSRGQRSPNEPSPESILKDGYGYDN